jgi:hypothetical protein
VWQGNAALFTQGLDKPSVCPQFPTPDYGRRSPPAEQSLRAASLIVAQHRGSGGYRDDGGGRYRSVSTGGEVSVAH